LSVKKILEDSAPKSISFPDLEADTEIFEWVQKGILLHKNSNDCKFCTNPLPINRISDLNSFYSKKLKEIQTSIDETQKLIDAEKTIINFKFPNKKDLAEIF